MQKYEHPLHNLSYKNIPQPFKSLYMYNKNNYTNKILKCITTPIMEDPIKLESDMFFFTYGSVEKNPGNSGYAWHGENTEYSFSYEHANYIGNVEIDAIISVLNFILNMNIINNKKNIFIFTDSLFAILLIDKKALPKFYHNWKQVENIRNMINKFETKQPNIKTIIIQKVKAHNKSKGNIKADRLAKLALNKVSLNKDKYHMAPYGVSRIQLKHYIGDNQIIDWHKRKNKESLVFRYLNRPSKRVKEVFFSMKRGICRNIIGILTEHNGLNEHKERLKFTNNNLGLCRFCCKEKKREYAPFNFPI